MKLYANSTEQPSIAFLEDSRWTEPDISFFEHEA
jgi:hypothetical protein